MRPCTFFQRVFAEICTFSREFSVEPYVLLWMSLLREIFCTTFSKTSHAVDTTRARANCVQNENSKGYALCVSCVWIATSRCNPNNSKLREQYSPRSLFDVNLSKGLFRLCGRHLLLVEFHKLGYTGAFAGSGGSSFCESVGVHNGAVIVLMGFAEFRRHG